MATATTSSKMEKMRLDGGGENNHDGQQTSKAQQVANFSRDFEQFKTQFDRLASDDSFMGKRLERTAKQVYLEYKGLVSSYLDHWQVVDIINNPKEKSERHLLEEDLKIVEAPLDEEEDDGDNEHKSLRSHLAGLFWRLSQGTYLRVTFNKSRDNHEDDRLEAVQFARYAIRLEPSNFDCLYWFMITIGWHLDALGKSLERTLAARVFYAATKRCIAMAPDHPLAYNLLGRYYFSVAQLTWFEKTLAAKLAGAKLEGSYELAEQAFAKSHKLKPDWLPNGLWMARCLVAQRRPLGEIRRWIEFGLAMDCREPTSELELRQLIVLDRQLLAKQTMS